MQKKISIYEIASAMGITAQTVRNRMKKAGLKYEKVETEKKRKASAINQADIAKIRRY